MASFCGCLKYVDLFASVEARPRSTTQTICGGQLQETLLKLNTVFLKQSGLGIYPLKRCETWRKHIEQAGVKLLNSETVDMCCSHMHACRFCFVVSSVDWNDLGMTKKEEERLLLGREQDVETDA